MTSPGLHPELLLEPEPLRIPFSLSPLGEMGQTRHNGAVGSECPDIIGLNDLWLSQGPVVILGVGGRVEIQWSHMLACKYSGLLQVTGTCSRVSQEKCCCYPASPLQASLLEIQTTWKTQVEYLIWVKQKALEIWKPKLGDLGQVLFPLWDSASSSVEISKQTKT